MTDADYEAIKPLLGEYEAKLKPLWDDYNAKLKALQHE